MVRGAVKVGGSEGAMVAPARDTTVDVMMPSSRSRESFFRSDHMKNTPIIATVAAIKTGASS
jgi:hypothetical protein